MTVTPTVYLITRTGFDEGIEDQFVDGIFGVLINLDATVATTSTLQIAEALKVVNAAKLAGGGDEDLTGADQPSPFRHDYFNNVQVFGTPGGAAGGLSVLNTSYILQDVAFGGRSAVQAAVA